MRVSVGGAQNQNVLKTHLKKKLTIYKTRFIIKIKINGINIDLSKNVPTNNQRNFSQNLFFEEPQKISIPDKQWQVF